MKQAQDQERAIRLRNNKRRHRERQKEYVSDLERRLAESREKGIHATREVQAAAQRVSWENSRLKQILRDQGLDNDAIYALVYGDTRFNSGLRTPKRIAEQQDKCNATRSNQDLHSTLNIHESSSPQILHHVKSPEKAPCLPPCKLLSILAENPRADLTQVLAGAHEPSESEKTDSTGCVQAREMLMPFATTEDKLDNIAVALEKGCVKDGTGRGCRVKNDILWKTLDRILE